METFVDNTSKISDFYASTIKRTIIQDSTEKHSLTYYQYEYNRFVNPEDCKNVYHWFIGGWDYEIGGRTLVIKTTY